MNLRMRTVLTTAVAILLSLTCLPSPAHADDTTSQPVVVVADFSGSMNKADADAQGTTRIEAAKHAVSGLLKDTPEGSMLGLVVFGANNDSCQDIQTINPVGEFDADALTQQVEALGARGNTPIGPALSHAAKELDGIEGPRSIVLVSDGEPNCEPPPACDVAKELAAQGIDLTVHTIGFKISGNQKARQTLQCIADATGGSYTDVDDAEDLSEALSVRTIRALDGYQSAGIQVEGGDLLERAEEIVAGQYVVKMVSGPEPSLEAGPTPQPNRRYFAVPFHEGWDITLSATLVPPAVESSEELNVERGIILNALTSTGRHCMAYQRQRQSGSLAETDLTALVTINADGLCNYDDLAYFSIARYLDGWAEEELDIEFTVTYHRADEEAIDTATEPPAPTGSLQPGAATEVAGGNSYNTATPLQPGQTISDTVNPGERRYFTVPIGFSQTMQARLEAEEAEGVNLLGLSAFNPLRQLMRFGESPDRHTHGNLTKVGGSDGFVLEAPLAFPIMPGNGLGSAQEKLHAIPGEHYLVVGRDAGADRDQTALPYRLTVEVFGEATPGSGTVIANPAEYEAEFGPAVEPSPSPSPEQGAQETSQSPAPEGPETPEVETLGEESQVQWVPLLSGAGVLLIVVGGVWYLLTRRGR